MKVSLIFQIANKRAFELKALDIFNLQAEKNFVYKKFLNQMNCNPAKVKHLVQIPFMPIEFFKTQDVVLQGTPKALKVQKQLFLSSGTTGTKRSKHIVGDVSIYEKSFRHGFELFMGNVQEYAVIALLPSYYENKNSSLLYMVKDLIERSKNKHSAFYNIKDDNLISAAKNLLRKKQKVILFGVSFALLDIPENVCAYFQKMEKKNLIVIETGGMKGRREELTRIELHTILAQKFNVKKIYSEYGMTELLSQAYSKGEGIFKCPPWMKVLVSEANDPLTFLPHGSAGVLNIIDLANINSCSFIATQDIGRTYPNGTFEVLGRVDYSDLRGCNLLVT